MICKNCSKELPERKRKSSKFCDAKCMAEFTKKEIIKEWESDPSSANTKVGVSKTVRDHLLEQAGHKCQECGFEGSNPVSGKTILEIDHIDGDCFNNSKQNLRVICPNCHAMSPNYRALNKKSGRKRK